jgi:hypothetical protein
MTKVMYLATTAIVSDQKISDRTPRTFGRRGSTPEPGRKHSLIVYNGEVPRSP